MSNPNFSVKPPVILVTLPDPRGEELCALLAAQGVRALHFPTITFVPPDQKSFEKAIDNLTAQDWLIFVSPQAVRMSSAYLQIAEDRPKLAAVGAGTAKILQDMGYSVLYPTEDWCSEGLLALPALRNITGQKITIISGGDGRELLANELAARGAIVSSLIAYRRITPSPDPAILQQIQQGEIDFVIVTSIEAMQNLQQLVGEKGSSCLYNVGFVVASERIKQWAVQQGFRQIWPARNASHEAILATLQHIMALN